MNAKKLDPRGQTGKRGSGSIRRFLAMAGLLPPRSTRVADRHDPRQRPGRVQVWDAKAGAFRRVDPGDPNDPLKETARQLARLQTAQSRDGQPPQGASRTDSAHCTAAARDRLTGDPPRSPFGGGNGVALDTTDG